MFLAWAHATSLWMGASPGSWFDLRSQPAVLELPLLLRMHGKGVGSGFISAWTSMSIADAMYSFVLSVKAFASASVNL